ncbi:alpha-L-fucosidase [Purpureocillium lavendulum]|uniref:alpha-L-fucosidase n=1 Tax=Purpureocillium lavendulum TaxID=1247861 RepID=A0AB34FIM9_9HYPO|nr:alpha-L-fucosidase [Purpureocillium lavendulum]
MVHPRVLSALLAALPLASGSWANGHSVQVPLESLFNNKAFGASPGEASLNILNESYPADPVGVDGVYNSTSTGVSYRFPGYNADRGADDNVICSGQTIHVDPSDSYFAASMLLVSDTRSTTVSGNVTLMYSDNTTSTAEIRAHAFWWFLAIRRGEITFPYFFTHNDTNHNASHIYERSVIIEPGKTLKGMVLPNTTNSTTGRLHLFSLSLWERGAAGLQVQHVRPTQNTNEAGHQLVEVVVDHAGGDCVSHLAVAIEGHGVRTQKPTLVKRICSGDQKKVLVAVKGKASDATVKVSLEARKYPRVETSFDDVDIGIHDWSSQSKSLAQHEVPRWYDGAKFGIFIHWGPYAVPGWGNSTPYESYAEWFWWYSTRVKEHAAADRSGFNAYRLRTFGPDLNYDDFFENYTASKYEPKEWVDLFADSGAKYFVFTTKHHDGFANFDTGATTNRSSLHYGPRRDILGELFEAAKTHQPHLKRGTYFSLPEWFNPDWGKYGFTQFDRVTSTSHPGIIARNPYTGLNEPYTGRLPIGDFIKDLMVPQMKTLAYKYDTDIMWCDAGASNGTDVFAAEWFNWARSQGRQVTINDRCGSPWAADFDTPEYATFSVAQARKWESNQGMDPFSYGFNRATPDDEYMNATTLVHNLVDIVSKNGNLLLNIGPRADGSIHQKMMDHLREAGSWIHRHETALFNTTYWYVTPEEGDLRFTQTNDAFYILSLKEPEKGAMSIESKIPIVAGDKVVAVGMDKERPVEWRISDAGHLELEVTDEMIAADKFCWVFQVRYSSQC